MARQCPRCGSPTKIKGVSGGRWQCGICGYTWPREEARVGEFFAGVVKEANFWKKLSGYIKREKAVETKEEKKVIRKKPSSFALIMALIGLFITFILPIDPVAKFWILIGLTITTFIFAGSRLTTWGLAILCVYLFFTSIPMGQGLMERLETEYFSKIGISFSDIQKNLFCRIPCIISSAFSTRTPGVDIDYECSKQCKIIEVPKQGCVDCLVLSVNARTKPVMIGSAEIIDINLKMESNADRNAKNIWLEVMSEDGIPPTEHIACTSENKCEIEPGKSKTVTVTYDSVTCKKTAGYNWFKYNASVTYDYGVGSENKFDVKQSTITTAQLYPGSTKGEVLSRSTSGPLSLSIGLNPEYVAGEDRFAYVSIYFVNEGFGIANLSRIEVLQIPPSGYSGLEWENCLTGYHFRGAGVSYENNRLTVEGNVDWLKKDESDAITCKFKIPDSIPVSKLTYSFKGNATYSYTRTAKEEVRCVES